MGMLVVETIAKIRRAYFAQNKPIKTICRGTLRNFGLKVGVVGGSRYEARVRELVAGFPRLTAIAEPLLIVRRVRDYQEFRARRAVETIRPWRL